VIFDITYYKNIISLQRLFFWFIKLLCFIVAFAMGFGKNILYTSERCCFWLKTDSFIGNGQPAVLLPHSLG